MLAQTLSNFLGDPEKRVLILKGKWGVGKTFAWKRFLESNTDFQEYAVSYVSLFGLKDINEVRLQILQKAVPKNAKKLRRALEFGVPLLKLTKHIPGVEGFWNAGENLAPLLIRRFLICFDDIERKSPELSLSGLLGLVSLLKEENNCRVVLILNEDQLEEDDKRDLNKYREKIVDREVEYAPSVTENLDLIFDRSEFPAARAVFQKLAINNIRIMKFALWNARFFSQFLGSAEESLRNSFIENVTILTCLFHLHGSSVDFDNLPPSGVVVGMFRGEGEKPSPAEALLQQAVYFQRDYDQFIVQYLRTGTCDKEELSQVFSELNKKEKKSRIESELGAIWKMYGDNFQGTKENLIIALQGFLDKHRTEITFRDLAQICNLTESLGSSELSTKLKDEYLQQVLPTADLRALESLASQTHNPKLLEQIDSRKDELRRSVSLKSIIYRLATQRAWNPEDEVTLDSFSEQAYHDWIKSETDEELISHLRNFHGLAKSAGSPLWRSILTKLEASLRRIGNEDPLHRVRVESLFGIKTQETTQPAAPDGSI